METKEVIGCVMLIIAFVLAGILCTVQINGDSIPIMLGVSSETAQIIIIVLVAIATAALPFVATYLITDGELTWFGIIPAVFLFVLLVFTSIFTLPSVKEGVKEGFNQLIQEATEYSTEMSEYIDPDTGVHYWVQDGGMTPRLNPDGTIMVTSQEEMNEFVDPDTGVHYWIQDGGMTPRLNPDGTIMVTPQD